MMNVVALESHVIETVKQQSSSQSPERRSDKPGSIRRTIAATRSGTKLMRQVSALGMEDPVFQTTESGPDHPSNIFDDMGLEDIPSDMLDMVSIASDRTAAQGDGLDVALFQMNLSTTQFSVESRNNSSSAHKRPSLLDSNRRSFMGVQPRSLLEDHPGSPAPRMEDSSNSSFTPHGSSSSKDNSNLIHPLKRKTAIKGLHVAAPLAAPPGCKSSLSQPLPPPQTSQPHPSPSRTRPISISPRKSETRNVPLTKSSLHIKELLNSSLPSFDVDRVFGGSLVKSPSLSFVLRDTPRKKRSSPTTKHNRYTDNLLAEAAQAMEEQGSVCLELIEAAKCQQASNSTAVASTSFRVPHRHHDSTNNNSIPPIQEDDGPSVEVVAGGDGPPRRRVMPTLSGLFPDSISTGSVSATGSSEKHALARRKSEAVGVVGAFQVTDHPHHQGWDTLSAMHVLNRKDQK